MMSAHDPDGDRFDDDDEPEYMPDCHDCARFLTCRLMAHLDATQCGEFAMEDTTCKLA